MKYPRLNTIPASRSMTNIFGGYDHRTVISEGNFFDMKNLSSDKYPVLANRKRRGIFKNGAGHITGVISKDKLCYTRYNEEEQKGEFVICNDNGEEEAIDIGLDDKEKQLVSMGANVVIFPDKKYVNTANTGDSGSLIVSVEETVTESENTIVETSEVTYSICDAFGTALNSDNTAVLWYKPSSNDIDGLLYGKKYCCQYDDINDNKIVGYYTRNFSDGWVRLSTFVRIDVSGNTTFQTGKKYKLSGINAVFKGSVEMTTEKIEININENADGTITALKGGQGFLVVEGSFYSLDTENNCIITPSQNTAQSLKITIPSSSISAILCDIQGDKITLYGAGDSLPFDEAPSGKYFLFEETTYTELYKGNGSEWVKQTPYVRLDFFGCTNLNKMFLCGDLVDIKLSRTASVGNLDIIGDKIVALGSSWIALEGMAYDIDASGDAASRVYLSEGSTISVALKPLPDLDFVIESGNRLWGCKYGDIDGKKVNEIYASKLGDFKRWYSFAGTSQDSYSVSVGSDGPFTGAVAYLGCPTFFKEDRIYKIYGSYPSNYQVQETECRGVEPGSHKSIATINEVLFYKSRSGICKYDGSLPVSISEPLGDKVYSNAVGGTLGNKYFVCMRDNETREDVLFVYDAAKGLWHKEDSVTITDFTYHKGELYGLEHDYDRIISMGGSVGVPDGDAVSWMAETGIIGTDMPDKKYISKLDIRMSLEVGHKARFSIEYDSSGEWRPLFYMSGTPLGSFSVPILPNRCDHFRLRIEGDGEVRIFSICKTVEQGGE